jgi:methionyl-tRNA synthetase
MAADLELPHHVFVHGFLLGADGRKMSKSLGNVLDPFEVLDQFGTDALRFYLMRDVPFGADGAVGMDGVKTRYDAELANEYGNLASRTVGLLQRYRDGVIPEVATDGELAHQFDVLPAEVAAVLDRADPTRALDLIWQRVRRLNRYVEERAPWELAKDEENADRLDETLASIAEGLRAVTVLLYAYMPETAERLLVALGAPETKFERALFAERGSGATVTALEPLFPKQDA